MRSSLSTLFLFYIAILVFATGCASSHKTSFTNISWSLVQINGVPVVTSTDNPVLPTLKFEDKKSISGFTGCNTFSGIYQLDQSKISIVPGAMTKKFCGGYYENDFINALKYASEIKVIGNRLVLYEKGKETLQFRQ